VRCWENWLSSAVFSAIPYVKEEQAEAATKDPYLKLVLRLIDCHVVEPGKFCVTGQFYPVLKHTIDADELEWYFPAAVTPDDLQKHLDLIAGYLDEPVDLGGKAPAEAIQKKRAVRRGARRTRRSGIASSSDEAQNTDDDLLPKKRRIKRKKEEIEYKSAEFIDDSDIDFEADAEFLAKEEELRRRAEAAAELGKSTTMRATGTKKRKRGTKTQGKGPNLALQGADDQSPAPRTTGTPPRKRPRPSQRGSWDEGDSGEIPPPPSSAAGSPSEESRPKPRPRPRYAPSSRATTFSPASSPAPGKRFPTSSTAGSDAEAPQSIVGSDADDGNRVPDAEAMSDDDVDVRLSHAPPRGRRKTLVFSDDEE
jgi:replication fork protection complex subunit Tof1/Swi1